MNNYPEYNFLNILLVAGTGRNTGKTSFVCQICKEWNLEIPLICFKISNHFHEQLGSKLIFSSPNFNIFEETQATTNKDTSRMLQAGASKVFFIEAESPYAFEAFNKSREYFPENCAIICESGALRRYFKPSIFIMLHNPGKEPKSSAVDLMDIADKIFYFDEENIFIPSNHVIFTNQQWKINLQ